jgi:hypothetical protein
MHATIALAARCAEDDSSLTVQEVYLITQELANIHGLDGHDRDVLLDAAESFTAPMKEVLEDLVYDPTAAVPMDVPEWAQSSLPFQRSIAKSSNPALALVPSHDTQREISPQGTSGPQSGPAPARMALVQPRAGARPIPFVLGGIVVAGAAAAIAMVLSTSVSYDVSYDSYHSYEEIAAHTTADAGSLADATVVQPPSPSAASSAVVPQPAAVAPKPALPPSPTRAVQLPVGATIDVEVDSVPSGAQIILAGAVLGTTPFHGTARRRDGDVTLVLRLTGYVDRSVVVRADRPVTERIKLVRSTPARAPKTNRDQSVNPFGN